MHVRCVPESSGGVDDVQGAVAEAGLPVRTPCRLLCVAVPSWVACACAVAITLHQHNQDFKIMQHCTALHQIV